MREAYAQSGKASEELVQLALMGAIVGFAPPAIKATITALVQWMDSGELWQFKGMSFETDREKSFADLGKALLKALINAPVPPVLYRTAMSDVQLGGEQIDAGSFVIVGTHSACMSALDQKDPNAYKWMFGGDFRRVQDAPKGTSATTAHGCPGRFAALDAMLGIIAAILELEDLRREGPLALSYAR